MTERVARLEAKFEHVDLELAAIRAEQRDMHDLLTQIRIDLGNLPTKRDLDTWRWTWMGTGLVIIVLVVSLTFGGIGILAAR